LIRKKATRGLLFRFLISACRYFLAGAEKERNAPYTRKRHKRENNSGHKRARAAEEPGNYIKSEKTDTAPVERADYNKQKCYSIEHLIYLSVFKVKSVSQRSASILPAEKKIIPPKKIKDKIQSYFSCKTKIYVIE
jgi:hypothetical protein